MSLHLICIVSGPKALVWVAVEEQKDDLAGVVRHRVRDLQWALLDVLKQLRLRSVEVRRNTNKHLVDEYTEKVPVDTP